MTIQNNNNSLNYLTDPTFTKVNRLFVLSFARILGEDHRKSFWHYYVQSVEIKDFIVLIDGRSFFDLPVKNEEAYEKISEMSKNNGYTTGNLLDFAYFKENYRLIAIDLSKQTKLKDPEHVYDQPINDSIKQYNEVIIIQLVVFGFCLFWKKYRLIGANLSKQKALDADSRAIQQVIFTGKTTASVANTWVKIYYILEQ